MVTEDQTTKYEGTTLCTDAELAVILDGLLIILLDVIWEVIDGNIVVFDILHNLKIQGYQTTCQQDRRNVSLTLFLKPRSSLGVKESALPMTGMTLTRGDRRRISSMSISRSL